MRAAKSSVPTEVLAAVAASGAADAGGLPVALLGDFLDVLADAVQGGQPIPRRQLRAYQSLGSDAAAQGVALRALLDLYLSSALRLWRHLPPVAKAAREPAGVVVAGEVMLHAVDDVVAVLTEGYQLARRALGQAQEAARREFIDDLLSGSTDVAGVMQRASGFGMDLSGPHAVAVITADRAFTGTGPLIGTLERAIQGSKADAAALLAAKLSDLVVVFPAPDRAAINHVLGELSRALGPRAGHDRGVNLRRDTPGNWQIAIGRSGIGVPAVVSSYGEARNTLELARRLGIESAVIDAKDLLVYQVLLRDRPVLLDLVTSTLAPLLAARGGIEPFLQTLSAYFNASGNAALTARDLHLSVRAVTYRLDRIRQLTGQNPAQPQDRFTLQVAVLGAKLLNWPVPGDAPRPSA